MNGTQKVNNDKIDALYSSNYRMNPELWGPIGYCLDYYFEINTCEPPTYQQNVYNALSNFIPH